MVSSCPTPNLTLHKLKQQDDNFASINQQLTYKNNRPTNYSKYYPLFFIDNNTGEKTFKLQYVHPSITNMVVE